MAELLMMFDLQKIKTFLFGAYVRRRSGCPNAGFRGSVLVLLFTLTLPLFSDTQLSENSPFLPPGHGKEETKKPEPKIQPQGPISREIEFRGIVRIGGVYQFSIYNKKEQKGYWLKENDREDGIAVNNYDADASTVVVLMNGRSERLTLMVASDKPMDVKHDEPSAKKKNRRPPQLRDQSNNKSKKRRNVPRRRVILPKKD